MKEKFKLRGYPDRVLDRMESENGQLRQNSDRNVHQKTQRIPFVNQFNLLSGEISKIIKKDWSLSANNLPDKDIFKSLPVMSYTRADTIGAKLVKADLGPSAGYKQTFLKTQKNFPMLWM
ncbi:hypothetical protein XELAEV_18012126mg [Xenopus laevis]|uniref:Uncharacterized protein n=1 Tax=Xenopus laevis TaxID=8355 RepID=A0A974DLY9_XENLA|nr:hypothetical protein XELAEV_18012126mg [Xenopus laevis]